MTPHSLVALALAGGIATVAYGISTRPALPQSDQWAVLLAKPVAGEKRKGPRFYIKRKKHKHEQRRARSRIPAQGQRAASHSPVSRIPFDEAPIIKPVRTIKIAPPFVGAFVVRDALPPPQDPIPVPMPPPIRPEVIPYTDTPQFKAVCFGAFCAALAATFIYAKGGKHARRTV